MTGFSWVALGAAILFWWLAVPALLGQVVPASLFMDVRKVEIRDARVGDPIPVAVDRTIYRDFDGAYRVDIRKEAGLGFAAYCTRSAENVPYRADATFGPDRDLNWWMGIPPNPPCEPPLSPGRYYAIVDYYIPILSGYTTLRITRQSNTFTIREASQ